VRVVGRVLNRDAGHKSLGVLGGDIISFGNAVGYWICDRRSLSLRLPMPKSLTFLHNDLVMQHFSRGFPKIFSLCRARVIAVRQVLPSSSPYCTYAIMPRKVDHRGSLALASKYRQSGNQCDDCSSFGLFGPYTVIGAT
jgi:hypothetical protein